MSEQKSSSRYMMAVIAVGLVCLAAALSRLPLERIDTYFLILSTLTILVGSRITIQIPRFRSFIAVSDAFIFLTLLLYGGEFAILLSAIEAFVSSWRFCNRKITVFFNASVVAVSTTVVVALLQVTGLNSSNYLHGETGSFTGFVIALSLIAMTQFAVNTALAAVYDALQKELPLWETWKSKYIWTFYSYFVGAIGAGGLIQLSDAVGIGAIFAVFPIILFVFLSYRMYMKNVEIAIEQAEQAESNARIHEAQAEALRESEARFRSAFDHAPIGIALVSPTGGWLKANHALTEILGYEEGDLLATDFQSLTVPEDLGMSLVKIHELLTGKCANCQMEQRYIHKNGRTVWTQWSASPASEDLSKHPNLIFQIQDITDKKQAEQKLQYDATHDALTKLPNRQLFMNRLRDALSRSREAEAYRVSVLFIDLDRFKYVNDSLGHLVGDQLLREISSRLRDCMRPSDMVARLGGDEFTVLVEGGYDQAEVTRIAERIQHKFSIPFNLDGHEIYSSASIGILNASEKHKNAEDVMRDADTAMYQAKRAGKARHEVFDDNMHSAAKEILRLETDLRRAVEREEISVEYQPICDLRSREIIRFEALARWNHSELGPISPNKFIPLAEEIGLIDPLCEHVLRRSCRDIGTLGGDGRAYSVSMNLSCRQFAQPSLGDRIQQILDETNFRPDRLCLEITESVFFEHQDRAAEMLGEIRRRGIEINIDDFGTGYSNLGYLTKLPVSALKIDRSFVSMIDDKGMNDEVVGAIITLARNLGLKVIAEGIETPAQLQRLTELGCEAGQGFLLARPMNSEALATFLRSDIQPVAVAGPFSDIPTIPSIQ